MEPKLIVKGSKLIVMKKLTKEGIRFEEKGDELILMDFDMDLCVKLCELFVDDLVVDIEGNIRMRSDMHGYRW